MKKDYSILKQLLISILFILLFGFLTSVIFISVIFAIDYKPIYLITLLAMFLLWLSMFKYHNNLHI